MKFKLWMVSQSLPLSASFNCRFAKFFFLRLRDGRSKGWVTDRIENYTNGPISQVCQIGVFDISIGHVDNRYIDTFQIPMFACSLCHCVCCDTTSTLGHYFCDYWYYHCSLWVCSQFHQPTCFFQVRQWTRLSLGCFPTTVCTLYKQGTFLQSLGSQVWLNVLDFTGFTTFMIFATISRLSRFTNFTRLTCFIVSLVSQSSLLWLIFTTFTGLNS